MKAAYITQTGPPDVITYGDLPTPKPSRRQCLIKVGAVDVNPIDVYVRSGAIPAKLSFPFILGRDLAGTVVEAGASVKNFKAGDRVWATSQGSDGRPGTFAEFAAVDHRWLHPIPESLFITAFDPVQGFLESKGALYEASARQKRLQVGIGACIVPQEGIAKAGCRGNILGGIAQTGKAKVDHPANGF